MITTRDGNKEYPVKEFEMAMNEKMFNSIGGKKHIKSIVSYNGVGMQNDTATLETTETFTYHMTHQLYFYVYNKKNKNMSTQICVHICSQQDYSQWPKIRSKTYVHQQEKR